MIAENQFNMKKEYFPKIFGLIFGLTVYQFSFSQEYAKNWVSGNFGLVFNDAAVSIRKDYAYNDSRGAGIISNAEGNLLFYTNGLEVRNRNHEIMPNGDSILLKPTATSIQESLIVPQPRSGSLYYIFTTDPWNGQETSGLYYSVVDMNLDNGKGDVIVKRKRLLEEGSNKITAVYHQNGEDVWIVTHQHNSNRYYSFLLTTSGITATPVVNQLGKTISSNFDGQLKASPDGKRVACSYDDYGQGFGLFDFNSLTGELSNAMNFTLPAFYRPCDALEFSPDARKLYVYQGGSTGESGLYQYDLSAQGYDEIDRSRVLLYSEIFNSFRQMQLATDGKIYITKGGGGGGIGHLGIIEHTNGLGQECVVKENGLYLEGQNSFVASTPNFIQNYFFKTSFSWDQTCQASPVTFNVTNTYRLDSARWYFGEGSTSRALNPKFTYALAGDYKVSLIAYYPDKNDTIIKNITINPFSVFDLGKDTTVCPGHILKTPEKFPKYFWSYGDTTRSITVKEKGRYKVTVKNSYGCYSSDSILIDVATLPVIIFPDTMKASGLDSIQLVVDNFSSYEWSTGATTSSVYVKEEGWYSVAVKNSMGCTSARSVFVQWNKPPQNEKYTDWVLLNPKPSLNSGNDIYFINSNTGFIVTNKELLKTDDAGATWNKVMNLVSGKRITFKNRIGYIIGDGGTIYKSTHDGVGWNKIPTSFNDNLNAISVVHPDTLFVTGDQRLFTSLDGGKTWKITLINGVDIEDSYFTSSKTGHVACKYGKILKTQDGGNTWYVTQTSNVTPSNFFRMTFVNDQIGYASQEFSEIYKTINGGESWEKIASLDAAYGIFFLNKDTGYIVGEYGAIHKTNNGGKTWHWKGSNGRIGGNDLYGIYFVDEETGFVTGLHGRILKTRNGGTTWSEYATIYNDIQQLQFTSEKRGYFLVGSSLYGTSNRGDDWTRLGPVVIDNVYTRAFDFTNDTVAYAIAGGTVGTSMGSTRVYKTINGGKSWTQTGIHNNFNYDDLRYIDFIDSQTGFVSAGWYGTTYKTSDGGVTWELLSVNGLVKFQFFDSQKGYAIGNYKKLFKTQDGGKTWTQIFDKQEDIQSFHFVDELRGYITGDNSLMYRTDDGGETWKKLVVPYEYYTNVRFVSPNVGYLLDEEGNLYQTADAGATWKNVHSMYGIRSIELRNQDIYISGAYGRILRNTIRYDTVSVSLLPVQNLKSKKVTLIGVVASNDADISEIQFQFGSDLSFGSQVKASPEVMQGLHADSVYADVTGLSANTTYFFRMQYQYNEKVCYTNYSTFKTPAEYEIGYIYSNSNRCNEEMVYSHLISNDAEITQTKFQYGKDTLFTMKVDATPGTVPAGSMLDVSGKLVNLEPATQYYCRLKALYQGKEIFSRPISFRTLPAFEFYFYSPDISGTSAKVAVQVNSYGDTLKNIVIEYGRTREYLQKVSTNPNQVTYGQATYMETILPDLQSNSVYFYRLKAQYGSMTVYSRENILNLTGGVVIEPATILQKSDSSLLLQGLINAGGKYLYNIKFEYGTTPELGDSILANTDFYYDQTRNISSLLHGLTPRIKYYFRIKATDGKTFYYSEIYSYILKDDWTDIQITSEQNKIMVYPNPSSDFIFIDLPETFNRVEFLDINGKVIEVKRDGHQVNISNLPEGFYYIRIYTKSGVQTCKLLKL